MDAATGISAKGGSTALPAIRTWRRRDFTVEMTPVFWAGLWIRIALCVLFLPAVQENLFIPFMRETLLHPSLDPWTALVAAGGAGNAFPYGVAMYLAHAPTVALGMGLDSVFGVEIFTRLGFSASLILADYALYVALRRLFEDRQRLVGWFYWLSPIVIFATYYHGQTDIVPVAFLGGALLALRHHWAKAAGLLLALAVSAKFSMLIAAPFLILYALNNRQFRPKGFLFLATAALAIAALQIPTLLSSGAREMIYMSPEAGRLYRFALPIGEGYSLYLFFVGYAAAVYAAFAVGRINFDLLFALLGVGFLTVLTLAPAAPGWYVWCAPFLAFYQLREDSRERAVILVAAYSTLFVVEQLLLASGARAPLMGVDFTAPLSERFAGFDRAISLVITLRTLAGVMIAASLYRRGVASNDYFRLSRKPIAIGIAGDSGAGKDTLADALKSLFSPNSVISVSGDDYHRYERGAPMWQVMTHLDPRANDIKALTLDVQKLIEERSISHRHYDHGTGRFTTFRRVRGNDVVLVSGLHTFYSAALRDMFDATVFLDMEDALRRHLKIRRDVHERGADRAAAEASIDRRADDRNRFIQPQRERADLVLSLRPVDPARLDDPAAASPGPLKLSVSWRDATDFADLARSLIALSGVRLDQQPPSMDAYVEFEVEGDIEAEDIRLIADRLAPEAEDLLGPEPQWRNGLLGVMQLIVIIHLIRKTRQRRMKD